MTSASTAALLAVAAMLVAAPATGAPRADAGQVVRVEHRAPDTSPTRGPAAAPVTIELFFVPQPNMQSRPAFRTVEQLQAKHPSRIRVIYRVLSSNAQVMLPNAALEAHAHGKFSELMDQLHVARNALTKDDLWELGKKLELDVPRLAAAIETGRYKPILDDNRRRQERLLRSAASTHGMSSQQATFFNAKPVNGTSLADFERAYQLAYESAQEMIDRGVDPRHLMEAFDSQVLSDTKPFSVATRAESGDEPELSHKLASPPLSLAGLPSLAEPGAATSVPIALLCRPSDDDQCAEMLSRLRRVQRMYPDEVRLVWGPWFDVRREDAATLTLLGDAALCAEQLGSAEKLDESPGWPWIERQLQSSRGRASPERLIDKIAGEVDIDPAQLSACRARNANATLAWIERARKSGVTGSQAVVIGGRIYPGELEQVTIQRLVEAELAPGVLGEVAPDWRGSARWLR